jgi:hypothetical protein
LLCKQLKIENLIENSILPIAFSKKKEVIPFLGFFEDPNFVKVLYSIGVVGEQWFVQSYLTLRVVQSGISLLHMLQLTLTDCFFSPQKVKFRITKYENEVKFEIFNHQKFKSLHKKSTYLSI